MFIDKSGKIMANVAQPTKKFDTLADYNTWVASLAADEIKKFVIIKNFGTPSMVVNGAEVKLNVLTSLDNTATDTDLASAKCVYDLIGTLETDLHKINSGDGV